MLAPLEKFDTGFRLAYHRAKSYRPFVSFSLRAGPYTVKTVSSYDELVRCLRLRFEVFHLEYMQKNRVSGVDIDGLDMKCDHLAILHEDRVVGTYRMNSSRFADRFYSCSEFEMSGVLDLPGEKLELGRACIAREHRDGRVIAALWRGIAEYLRMTETRYMFGCTSVKTVDVAEIAGVHNSLVLAGAVDTSLGVVPVRKHRVRDFSSVAPVAAEGLVPSLLTSYLKMNAVVCGEPALDREFGCFDYLTLLDIEKMPAAYRARYSL